MSLQSLMKMRSLDAARVAVISGKGGVGKTTVAACLALAAAERGLKVLLCEVEQRNGLAPILGLEKLGYPERQVDARLFGMSIEPDESLVEYLQHFYGIPRMSRALVQSKAVEFATQVAPGLRDILLLGKIKEAESRVGANGRPTYDLIVVDAPPTGRLPRFLDAPRGITEMVKAGPIGRHAESVREMVSDHKRLQVVLVTLPEELPMIETVEALEALDELGVANGAVVCNQVWPELRDEPKREELVAAATAAGLASEKSEMFAGAILRSCTRAHKESATIRDFASQMDAPLVLPYRFVAEIGRTELEGLADVLADEGALS